MVKTRIAAFCRVRRNWELWLFSLNSSKLLRSFTLAELFTENSEGLVSILLFSLMLRKVSHESLLHCLNLLLGLFEFQFYIFSLLLC